MLYGQINLSINSNIYYNTNQFSLSVCLLHPLTEFSDFGMTPRRQRRQTAHIAEFHNQTQQGSLECLKKCLKERQNLQRYIWEPS